MEIKIKISDGDIADMVTSALEGGSNYWAQVVAKRQPTKMTHWAFTDGKDSKAEARYLEEFVMNEGGSVTIKDLEDPEGKTYELTREKVYAGLELMPEEYTRHFVDILNEETDATTGDVLIQLALFGDVIYG